MKRWWSPVLLIVPAVLCIQVLTMPDDIAGDGTAIRKVSAWLAQTGEFGLPYSQRENLGRFLQFRNQWFVENDEHQKFYSRWGEMNTLLYTIPEWLRNGSGIEITRDQLLYTNGLNVFLATLLALYLVLIARGLNADPLMTTIFVLTCLYGSFTWHYLRMQTYEIFQITFFTAFFFHFTHFAKHSSFRHLIASQAFLFAAIHVKPLFLVFYGPIFVFLYYFSTIPKRSRALVFGTTTAFMLFAIATHLGITAYKLGQFSLSGDPPPPEGWTSDFAIKYIPARLTDYFWKTKSSFLLHFPQIFLAATLWPAFHKKNKQVSVFLLLCLGATALPLVAFCSFGEWCYGPRYWIFLTGLLMLPVLTPLSPRKPGRKYALAAALTATGLTFAYFQWQFNSRPFFLRHNLNAFLVNTDPKSPDGQAYLATTNDKLVAWDFNRFLAGNDNYPLVAELVAFVGPDRAQGTREELRQMLGKQFPCNFYFQFLCVLK